MSRTNPDAPCEVDPGLDAPQADEAPAVHRTVLACRSARPTRRTSRTAFFEDAIDPDDPLLGFQPYEHVAPRRNSITPDRQRAFIAALAASGIVTQAARTIGASLEALYKLRNLPGAKGFAEAWELAIDRGMARLEDCALERAILGEERPIVRDGEVVATWTRHNPALMLFLLRQRRGHRFGADVDPVPGSAVFEKVRARIDAAKESPAVIRERLNARIDRIVAAAQASSRRDGVAPRDEDGD